MRAPLVPAALIVALAFTAGARAQDAPAGAAAGETELPEGNTAHASAEEGIEAAAANELRPIPLTPAQEARARALEGRLKCPVCRSQSIRSSRSFMAEDMQRKIREMISEGSSDEEIVDFFVARYGEYILLTPPKRGFNLTAYVVPFLVVVIGGTGLVYAARRWSRREAPPPPSPPPPESPYLARLERELEETE